MSFSTTAPRSDYVGTGSLATYNYTFKIQAAADLRVTTRTSAGVETALVYLTDYTVTGVGNANGGSITLVAGNLASGTTLTIRLDRIPQQATDLRNQGSFNASTHEDKFDEIVRYIQAHRDVLSRSLHLPETEVGSDALTQLPTLEQRLSKYLYVDSTGQITAVSVVTAGSLSVSAFIQTLLDDATAAAARTTLEVPAATNGAMTGAVLTTSTVAAVPTASLGIASKGYVDAGVIIGGNLLPNTQWQVCTGLIASTKQLAAGTGAIGATSVSSYTTGSNTVVFTTANTSLLAVGDIVSISAAAHANLKICTLEIESIVANTSFTCKLPINLTGAASAACTATPIVSGDVAGVTGDAADGWSKTSTLLCWRDMWSANVKAGSPYQLGVRKDSASDRLVFHTVPTEDVSAYVGRTIVFGVWVYHKVKGGSGTWRAEITTNGTGGTTTTSSAATTTAYEWLEVTVTVPTDATTITVGVNFKGNSADVYYISQPMLAYGSRLGSGNYAPQKGEWLIPIVKMTPLSYDGASVTFPSSFDSSGVSYGFALRFYPETNGAIAPTVRALSMQFEGQDDALGTAFAFRNQEAVPHIYGILNYCTVVSQTMSSEGILTLKSGKAWVYTITSGATWFTCSIDINQIRLN